MHFLTLNFFQLISICTSSYDISALWCRDCISNIRVTQIEHAQVLTCKLTRSSQTCRLRDIADSNTSFATLFKTDVLCNTGKLWLRKQRCRKLGCVIYSDVLNVFFYPFLNVYILLFAFWSGFDVFSCNDFFTSGWQFWEDLPDRLNFRAGKTKPF